MKLGLCILGCGSFAQTFASSIQPLLSDINIYFASRSLFRAEHYSHMFQGAGAFGSYTEAARDENIHAIYICTPHYLHLEHAQLAASEKKHILVEKPIASTVEDAKKIIALAKESNLILMTAENCRFMPTIRMSKQLVDQGTIGHIRTIQIQQESDYKPTQWRKHKELNGGGVFIDAGIHKIHYLRYLIGDPDYLYALTPQPFDQDDEVEDGLLFACKWKTGPVGLIYHSWTASAIPTPHWVSISGSYGRISFNMETPKLRLETGSDLQTFVISEPLNGLLSMAKEFVSSIREDREPETSGEEGLKDLELVYKAYESAKNRTSLPFNVH